MALTPVAVLLCSSSTTRTRSRPLLVAAMRVHWALREASTWWLVAVGAPIRFGFFHEDAASTADVPVFALILPPIVAPDRNPHSLPATACCGIAPDRVCRMVDRHPVELSRQPTCAHTSADRKTNSIRNWCWDTTASAD